MGCGTSMHKGDTFGASQAVAEAEEAALARLREDNAELRRQNAQLTSQSQELSQRVNTLSVDVSGLRLELSQAAATASQALQVCIFFSLSSQSALTTSAEGSRIRVIIRACAACETHLRSGSRTVLCNSFPSMRVNPSTITPLSPSPTAPHHVPIRCYLTLVSQRRSSPSLLCPVGCPHRNGARRGCRARGGSCQPGAAAHCKRSNPHPHPRGGCPNPTAYAASRVAALCIGRKTGKPANKGGIRSPVARRASRPAAHASCDSNTPIPTVQFCGIVRRCRGR